MKHTTPAQDEARREAIQREIEAEAATDLFEPEAVTNAFRYGLERGYDLGLAANKGWMSVEKDGLPTEEGEYVFYEKEMGFAAEYFLPGDERQKWATHYQKITAPAMEDTK